MPPIRTESRWPAIIAIVCVIFLLEFLPARVRVMPMWFPYAATFLLLAPMVGVVVTRRPVFMRVEQIIIYAFVLASIGLMFLTLERLLYAIIAHNSSVGGNALLASAIAIWVINVISFALLYWQLDRGGPDLRASGHPAAPDILFPEGPMEIVRPFSFMDYLFFAYTNSTAFSPTEMFPTTARAKLLMMLQSIISLTTIIFVAARAINILK